MLPILGDLVDAPKGTTPDEIQSCRHDRSLSFSFISVALNPSWQHFSRIHAGWLSRAASAIQQALTSTLSQPSD